MLFQNFPSSPSQPDGSIELYVTTALAKTSIQADDWVVSVLIGEEE
jgi:hypothetical protein